MCVWEYVCASFAATIPAVGKEREKKERATKRKKQVSEWGKTVGVEEWVKEERSNSNQWGGGNDCED